MPTYVFCDKDDDSEESAFEIEMPIAKLDEFKQQFPQYRQII